MSDAELIRQLRYEADANAAAVRRLARERDEAWAHFEEAKQTRNYLLKSRESLEDFHSQAIAKIVDERDKAKRERDEAAERCEKAEREREDMRRALDELRKAATNIRDLNRIGQKAAPAGYQWLTEAIDGADRALSTGEADESL